MRNHLVDTASLILRIVVGLVFVPHGYRKIFTGEGAGGFASGIPEYGLPAFLGYVVAYAEFLGALLLIAGFLTRLSAFLLACTMAVAAFHVHLPDALRMPEPGTNVVFHVLSEIQLPLTLLGATVAILLIGPGRYSIDSAANLAGRFRRKGRRR